MDSKDGGGQASHNNVKSHYFSRVFNDNSPANKMHGNEFGEWDDDENNN